MAGERCVSTHDRAKIDILFKEYDTLRTEVMARCNSRFLVVGFLVTLTVFVASESEVGLLARCLIGAFAVLAVAALWFRLGQLIKRCAVRIAEIEQKINKLMGEQLLAWESRIAKGGLFHKFYRNTPKS